jgi:hypothetical protein
MRLTNFGIQASQIMADAICGGWDTAEGINLQIVCQHNLRTQTTIRKTRTLPRNNLGAH